MPKCSKWRQSRVSNRSVKALGKSIQAISNRFQPFAVSAQVWLGCPKLESPVELFRNKPLVSGARMELQAGGSYAGLIQATMHDLQRDHLFGDKEDRLAVMHRARDDVRDRLRLPGGPCTTRLRPARTVSMAKA
jgi:hypothetical protein